MTLQEKQDEVALCKSRRLPPERLFEAMATSDRLRRENGFILPKGFSSPLKPSLPGMTDLSNPGGVSHGAGYRAPAKPKERWEKVPMLFGSGCHVRDGYPVDERGSRTLQITKRLTDPSRDNAKPKMYPEPKHLDNVVPDKQNWILGINTELRKVKQLDDVKDAMTPLLIAILRTIQGVDVSVGAPHTLAYLEDEYVSYTMEQSDIMYRLAASTKRVKALQFSIEAQAKLYKKYKPWLEANPYTEWLHAVKQKETLQLLNESTIDKTLHCAMGYTYTARVPLTCVGVSPYPRNERKAQADITAWTLTYPSTRVVPRWHSWLQCGCRGRDTTSQQVLEVLFDCYLPTGKGSETAQQIHTLSEGLLLDRKGYQGWNPHGEVDWLPLKDANGTTNLHVVKPYDITMWNARERVCKDSTGRTFTGNLELHRQKMAKIKRPSPAVRVIPTQQSLFKEWFYEVTMHLPLKNISAQEKEDAEKEREGGFTQAVRTWRGVRMDSSDEGLRRGVLGEYSHNWTSLPLRDWRLSSERIPERRQPVKEWVPITEAPIVKEAIDGEPMQYALTDMVTFLAMAQATVKDETKGAVLKLIRKKDGNWVVRVKDAELTPQWSARGLWFLGKEKQKVISDIGGLIKTKRKDNKGRTFESGELTWTKAHVHCMLMSRVEHLTDTERDCWILKAKLCAMAKGSKKNPRATFARNFDSAATAATHDAWNSSRVYIGADGWIPPCEDEYGETPLDAPPEDSDEVETEDDAPLYEDNDNESEPAGLETIASAEPEEKGEEVTDDGEALLDVAEAEAEEEAEEDAE